MGGGWEDGRRAGRIEGDLQRLRDDIGRVDTRTSLENPESPLSKRLKEILDRVSVVETKQQRESTWRTAVTWSAMFIGGVLAWFIETFVGPLLGLFHTKGTP